MRRLIAALAVLLLPASSMAASSTPSGAMTDQYFRLQWETATGSRGPVITGHVENVSNFPFHRMELQVDRLDANGSVVGSQRAWVLGTLVPNHKTPFSTQISPAASYRVSITGFDWVNCRD